LRRKGRGAGERKGRGYGREGIDEEQLYTFGLFVSFSNPLVTSWLNALLDPFSHSIWIKGD